MRDGLKVGEQIGLSITVDDRMRASLLGLPVHPLYGTAAMIEHMEWAARQHILPYLEPGEEGVGHHVNVKHLKPAPMGAVIHIESIVTDVHPRRVASRVKAWWHDTLIGEGTLVQALVQTEKLYACTQLPTDGMPPPVRSNSPQTEANVEFPAPPPAQLLDQHGTVVFQLEVLKWENGMFACTRYDEWLVCRAGLGDGARHRSGAASLPREATRCEGAFLLRYELEELLTAMQALSEQTEAPNTSEFFQSDFLEPVLRLSIQPETRYTVACAIQLTPPEQATQALQFSTTPQALQQFAQQLSAQLEGFPSRL